MASAKKKIIALLLIISLNFNLAFALNEINTKEEKQLYPDYSKEFAGEDKYENFNRKMFNFNLKLNKYVIKPVHILWTSIMPKYAMDRLQSAYNNIEYPKRLISSLVQRDFKTSGRETIRFLTNSTIGLGGLYDPAKKFFNIEMANEDMEQALCKCKMKRGSYLVLPVINSTSTRGIAGRLLDYSLDPTIYLGMPVIALVKMGLVVNRTSYMQPLIQLIESTYADPYDIAKKLYGLENYIKNNNLDRKDNVCIDLSHPKEDKNNYIVDNSINIKDNLNKDKDKDKDERNNNNIIKKVKAQTNIKNFELKNNESLISDVIEGGIKKDNMSLKGLKNDNITLIPDIILKNYNPQDPVVDSMRTALFEVPNVDNSIWADISLWNRSFMRRIKTSKVNVYPNREDYKFRFILQKDKNSPLAIIYPSIGEGIMSHHSNILAKIFYDEGYSVLILGSHFHWEFLKSMDENYRPGIPKNDVVYLKNLTYKIIKSLENKYDCCFKNNILIGTSFGAMATLFVASEESKNNTLNISKYISINPPIEVVYALNELDKNNADWCKSPVDLKQRVGITAAKIIQTAQAKEEDKTKIETLPFTPHEAKLITGFIMRQKLSDLIFTIENASKTNRTDIYEKINTISYRDYAEKYLLKNKYETFEDLNYDTSLHYISNFLENNNNYKIYHTLDDYFVNHNQLISLRKYSGNKLLLFSNGGHLGYLYRDEFINELKKDIRKNIKNSRLSYIK